MKLFGVGALWAVYALIVIAVSQIFMSEHPDRVFSISSTEFFGSANGGRARIDYEQLHNSQCAAWTKQSAILDHNRGATYQIRCNSWPRAIALNLLSALLVLTPVAVLFVFLRKRAK